MFLVPTNILFPHLYRSCETPPMLCPHSKSSRLALAEHGCVKLTHVQMGRPVSGPMTRHGRGPARAWPGLTRSVPGLTW
jgi:hypothetical protein